MPSAAIRSSRCGHPGLAPAVRPRSPYPVSSDTIRTMFGLDLVDSWAMCASPGDVQSAHNWLWAVLADRRGGTEKKRAGATRRSSYALPWQEDTSRPLHNTHPATNPTSACSDWCAVTDFRQPLRRKNSAASTANHLQRRVRHPDAVDRKQSPARPAALFRGDKTGSRVGRFATSSNARATGNFHDVPSITGPLCGEM